MTIRVNGETIDEETIDREVQYHPADTLDTARHQAASALVLRRLVLDQATAEDYAQAEGDEDAVIQAVIARNVAVPEPDEETCRRYYENNRARFRSPEIFEVCHILLPAAQDDEDGRERARDAAQSILDILDGDPAGFADMARAHSHCPSAKDGGHLGQVTAGKTVPEFETFLPHIEPGTLCPVPVPTRFGYHVIYLVQHVPASDLPFEAVRDRIARYLSEASLRQGTRQFLQILVGQADIAGIDLDGAGSPLVQ